MISVPVERGVPVRVVPVPVGLGLVVAVAETGILPVVANFGTVSFD